MPSNDPFSMVMRTLWEMANENAVFTDLVKPGNRIDFTDETNRDPIKQNIQDADVPEVILVPSGTPATNLCATSSTSSIIKRYSWLISTGDLRATLRLMPVEWAIFVMMHDWKNRLTALEWPENSGRNFVKFAQLLDASEGQTDTEANRGLQGWSCLWQCQVEMHFKSQDLLDLLT